jgi:anti-sigma factor RsiW
MSTNEKSNAAELMSAYVDGELDPTQAAEVESYIAKSPEAQQQLEELQRLVRLVGGLPPVEAPPDFYDKVARRVRRRQILKRDDFALNLISLPFQVLSILVILAVATLYMLAELEREPNTELERDPAAQQGKEDGDKAPQK